MHYKPVHWPIVRGPSNLLFLKPCSSDGGGGTAWICSREPEGAQQMSGNTGRLKSELLLWMCVYVLYVYLQIFKQKSGNDQDSGLKAVRVAAASA